jgi:hypothetical protein
MGCHLSIGIKGDATRRSVAPDVSIIPEHHDQATSPLQTISSKLPPSLIDPTDFSINPEIHTSSDEEYKPDEEEVNNP